MLCYLSNYPLCDNISYKQVIFRLPQRKHWSVVGKQYNRSDVVCNHNSLQWRIQDFPRTLICYLACLPKNWKRKQESIPVGCVPPTCILLHLPRMLPPPPFRHTCMPPHTPCNARMPPTTHARPTSDRMTHTCENSTFRFTGGKMERKMRTPLDPPLVYHYLGATAQNRWLFKISFTIIIHWKAHFNYCTLEYVYNRIILTTDEYSTCNSVKNCFLNQSHNSIFKMYRRYYSEGKLMYNPSLVRKIKLSKKLVVPCNLFLKILASAPSIISMIA